MWWNRKENDPQRFKKKWYDIRKDGGEIKIQTANWLR